MIGKTVSHYRILEKLAEGGMGIIYKAEDLKLKRKVVLKFLPPDITADLETKQRFIHEAQAASKLDHPNICTIHEIQETDSGQMFIVMAYYEGETLKDKIERGALSLEQTLDITIQITEGLARAHEEGIIHRDIKPANIIITSRGEVKILDFGLAKLAGRAGLTKEGIAVGTAAYMSPEQASGEEIDQRSDIWSIGVMLYEIVCKKLPFQGDTPRSVVYSILSKEPASISDCQSPFPEEYQTVVNKCLIKDKKKRYQRITDLQVDLILVKRSVMKHKLTEKIRSTPNVIPTVKRYRRILIPVVILFILTGILFFIPTTGTVIKSWLGIEERFREKRIAILDFQQDDEDTGNKAFKRGMVVRMTQKLSMLEKCVNQFQVIPNPVLIKEKVSSAVKARTVFRVNLVLTGKVKKTGNMVMLALNLVDAEQNRILKTEKFEDHITNLSVWQEGVILKLLEMLDLEIPRDRQSLITDGNTSFPGAFYLYLQGLGSCMGRCQNEDVDKAIDFYSQVVAQDESFGDAYAALGESYLQKYRLTKDPQWKSKGISACDRALQISGLLMPVYITKGKIYRQAGQFDLAVQMFQKAIGKSPADFDAYLGIALTHQDSKKLYKAEEMYKKAIFLKPDYWIGYEFLGYFYYSTGRLNEAEGMYLKVIDLNPIDITSINNLISIYNKKGDNIRARLMFNRSIGIKPNSVAYSNMGTNLFYQGRYADAREMYEEAIRLGRKDRRIWGNLADSYRYSGEYKNRAKEVYQKAVELSREELQTRPGSASIYSSLGLYLAKLGQYNNAIVETVKAIKLEPNNLSVIYNAIVVFEIAGKRHQALQKLKDYIARHGSIAVFSKDPDLSKLRNDLRYKKLIDLPEKSRKK